MIVVVIMIMVVIMVMVMIMVMVVVTMVMPFTQITAADQADVVAKVIGITVVVMVMRRGVSLFHPGLMRGAVQAPGRRVSRTRAIAAPKPLSMFTTVTPAAQLDSMPSSALTPPRLTP